MTHQHFRTLSLLVKYTALVVHLLVCRRRTADTCEKENLAPGFEASI